MHRLVDQVEDLVTRQLGTYQPMVTGLAKYFTGVEKYVLSTQIQSFALALAVTVLLLGLLSGSWRTGTAVVAVNVLPVVIVLGAMGWIGIPLDISTVMIASIAIGIVVDDTLHLLYRYRLELREGRSPEASLQIAFKEVGEPITAATVVLFGGFMALVPARFVPTSYFGGLSALIIVVAALAEIILLPAMISILHSRRYSCQN